jgi:hypothetical protein
MCSFASYVLWAQHFIRMSHYMQYAACGPFCARCHAALNVGPCNGCVRERLSYVLDGYVEHWINGFWLSDPIGPQPDPTGIQALANLYAARYPRGAILLHIDLTASRGVTALFWFAPEKQPQLLESLAAALQLLYNSECKGFAVIDSTLREFDVMYAFL